jgi:hypothetical protein
VRIIGWLIMGYFLLMGIGLLVAGDSVGKGYGAVAVLIAVTWFAVDAARRNGRNRATS